MCILKLLRALFQFASIKHAARSSLALVPLLHCSFTKSGTSKSVRFDFPLHILDMRAFAAFFNFS